MLKHFSAITQTGLHLLDKESYSRKNIQRDDRQVIKQHPGLTNQRPWPKKSFVNSMVDNRYGIRLFIP